MTHKYSSLKESQRFTEKERVTKREFSGGARGRVFTHIGGTDSQLIELLKKYDRDTRPCYYTAGMYGWNCDIYYLGIYKDQSCWFTWGNRPFGKEIEYSKLEDILKEITGIDSEDFEESLSWEKNNMLLKESLPVEDRHEYQKWQKDFEDNEISKRDAKRKQILEDKCDLFYDTIRLELEHTVAIREEPLRDVVRDIVFKGTESEDDIIGEIGHNKDMALPVQTGFYYGDYNYRHHTYNENLSYFFDAGFFLYYFCGREDKPKYDGNKSKYLSKLGYRQLADCVNKGILGFEEDVDGTFILSISFDTIQDEKAVDKIVDAIIEAEKIDDEHGVWD